MDPFDILHTAALPLDMANVDTDQIMPTRFMSRVRSMGFGQQLLYALRFDDEGQPRPDSIFSVPEYAGAAVLLTGANFGAGSSRESAVWALYDYGIRAIIAPSLGDTFINNCFKNGILCLPQDSADVQRWMSYYITHPGAPITVDLPEQRIIAADGTSRPFNINPFQKHLLQCGVDELAFTLRQQDAIAAFEQQYERVAPWSTILRP